MVVETRKRSSLFPFLESALCDSRILSTTIKEKAGNAAMRVFFNALHLHPDFHTQSKLQMAHRAFAKEYAQTSFQKIKTARQASFYLKIAITDRNPFLLRSLLKRDPRDFDENEYGFLDALRDCANQGDFHNLKRLYDRFLPTRSIQVLDLAGMRTDENFHSKLQPHLDLAIHKKFAGPLIQSAHRYVVHQAVKRGYFDIANWLLNNYPVPDSNLILALAFRSPNWRQMVPFVYSKIPPKKMKIVLGTAAIHCIRESTAEKLEFLLQNTSIRNVLNADDWGIVLTKWLPSGVPFNFIFNPNNQIPISLKYIRSSYISRLIAFAIQIDALHLLLPKVPAKEMKNALIQCAKKFAKFRRNSDEQEGKFYEHLNKSFSQYLCREFFLLYESKRAIERGLERNCMNILIAYVDFPEVLQALYVYESGAEGGKRYHKSFIISSELLRKISKKFEEVGLLHLKMKIDQEIDRRGCFATKINLGWSEIFGSSEKQNYPLGRK